MLPAGSSFAKQTTSSALTSKLNREALIAAIAPIGRPNDANFWISINEIKRLSGRHGDPGWATSCRRQAKPGYRSRSSTTNSLLHDNPAGSDSVHMENLFCQIDREQLHGYCLLLSVEP